MLDSKPKDLCRVCARELCGNQRRWIFHPAAKLSLQVLLSHALGWELTRDGRGEFVCSKCAFMLDRMYRFDTVIARVEALSVERMHKLLLEKDRLRQCIGGLYRKNNVDECVAGATGGATETSLVDVSVVSEGRYGCLLEEDLTYSVYESWAEHDSQEHAPDLSLHQCHARSEVSLAQRSRKCRGCAGLRVADSDYEAVCKVPRKVGRSTSCGPSTRYSTTILGSTEEACPETALGPPGSEPQSSGLVEIGQAAHTLEEERSSLSPATSDESLDAACDAAQTSPLVPAEPVQEETEEGRVGTQNPGADQKPRAGGGAGLELALSLIRSFECRPVQCPAGSRLPVPVRPVATEGALSLLQTQGGAICPYSTQSVDIQQELQLAEMEELWLDDYVQCRPPGLQKKLIGEQQTQLGQYEVAAGRCVSELQKAQRQVHSLQTKIRESEVNNKELQHRLGELDCELCSVREAAHGQERTIQNLNDCLNSKNSEVADLQRLTEEQEELLRSLKQQNKQLQLQQLQVVGGVPGQLQAEILELQASLFSSQLELQRAQRAQRHAQRREGDLACSNQRLLVDLQGALHQQQEAEKHKQELLAALQRARSDLELMEERWREAVEEKQREMEEREMNIRELQTSVQHKERLLQDYSELLDDEKDPGGNRDVLIHKLKQRIQERDRALERALDEKFVCVEQKEAELRRLQLRLREKERDLEKLRCVLSNNEETITSLEVLLRGKTLELEQVSEVWRSSQRTWRESENTHTHSLRERDTLINQLKSALHTHTQEAQDLKVALFSKVSMDASKPVEDLRFQVQLKERLFQELLANCSQNAQEHHTQVQDLLDSICTRDQYIKNSAERMGHVMSEQAARVQELRRQVLLAASASVSVAEPSADTLNLQEDLRLLQAREREAQSQLSTLRSTLACGQDQLHAQASELEALTRTVSIKDKIIKDLQTQLVEPMNLPLMERLTQELQELREKVSLQDPSCPNHKDCLDYSALLETEQAVRSQAPSGVTSTVTTPPVPYPDFTSDEEDEDENSEFSASMEEETSRLTAQCLAAVQGYDWRAGPVAWPLSQDAAVATEGQGLAEVKLLVEQKKAVERELYDLRAQLEKAGFSTFSQMRKALFSLQSENKQLRRRARGREDGERSSLEEEEEEEEEGQEQRGEDPKSQTCESRKRCATPVSLDPGVLLSRSAQVEEHTGSGGAPPTTVEVGLRECTMCLTSDLQQVQQESRELQQRLLVSEATVQAQAEQIKDYRELLSEHFTPTAASLTLAEASVQQDSKQVQVDLQDLGYETCGRSENEAERDEASSPEFDDLDLCTSLSGGDGTTQWWSNLGASGRAEGDVAFLRRMVEDLRAQLSRSQVLVHSLQARARDATPSATPSSTPASTTPALRKVKWGVAASRVQDGHEEDEGWQSSDGGGSLPRHARLDGGLEQLVARVTTLEEQLQTGKKLTDEGNSATQPGKFNALVQVQARELSHLRQRMREGRSLCHILTQHLGDATKAFEELLRANDIDYYMSQSFREQLTQSSTLAHRVEAKISSRDHSELPDDKTGHELLAIRLSKELQQKEKLIETLRSKLNQEQPCPDTPASSHALSEATDQSERMSFVSDEQGSTNEDLDMCSDLDAASQFSLEEEAEKDVTDSRSNQGSAPSPPPMMPSPTSSHDQRSSSSCPNMHCSPHRLMEGKVQTGLSVGPVSSSAPIPQSGPSLSDPQSQLLRPRYHGTRGFSLAEAQQELQMLQRQIGNSIKASQVRHLTGFPLAAQAAPRGLQPQSQHALPQAPLMNLSGSPVLRGGTSLMENSALWDRTYGSQQMRGEAFGEVSSGLYGYQSGAHHSGTGWMEEHLMEIRSLRQRLEDSIQTNERLRSQLEQRLTSTTRDAGAPTNIYIQGLDSITQLSSELQALKEENRTLQQASKDGMKEAEQLRQAVQSGSTRLKQAEMEAGRWAEQCRQLQEQVLERTQDNLQLKQDRQRSQENINRLQHEVSVLQQQLSESRRLVHTLQCDLQVYQTHSSTKSVDTGFGLSFDLQESQTHMCLLEKQLIDGLDPSMPCPPGRKQLFPVASPSPPVRDSSPLGPCSPLPPETQDWQSGSSEPCAGGWEGRTCDAPFASRAGPYVVGRVNHFSTLQQGILEAQGLVRKMETTLQTSRETVLKQGCGRSLLPNTKNLKQILEEVGSVLQMFWRAALPRTGTSTQHFEKEQSLKEEVVCLKRKLSERDQALRDALENLRSSNRTKDSMEHFIVSQLSRTRDVLKKARTNLEKNELKISLLSSSCAPLSSSSPGVSRGEGPSTTCSSSYGWGFMTPPSQGPARGTSDPWPVQPFGIRRPLEVVSGSAPPGLRAAVSPLW